ncbi:1105_t:CDS:1, partial [Acaulospora colombiana]
PPKVMTTKIEIDSSKEMLPHGFARLGEGIWFVKAENGSPSDLDPRQ